MNTYIMNIDSNEYFIAINCLGVLPNYGEPENLIEYNNNVEIYYNSDIFQELKEIENLKMAFYVTYSVNGRLYQYGFKRLKEAKAYAERERKWLDKVSILFAGNKDFIK